MGFVRNGEAELKKIDCLATRSILMHAMRHYVGCIDDVTVTSTAITWLDTAVVPNFAAAISNPVVDVNRKLLVLLTPFDKVQCCIKTAAKVRNDDNVMNLLVSCFVMHCKLLTDKEIQRFTPETDSAVAELAR